MEFKEPNIHINTAFFFPGGGEDGKESEKGEFFLMAFSAGLPKCLLYKAG